jgi:Zn-dependent M32 family carboxypeptidase
MTNEENSVKPKSSKIRTVAEVENSVNEAFADYSLEVEKMWRKAKNKMDYHGIGYGSIETIIESGKYAPEDIIEALESPYHDKIDSMRKDAEKIEKKKKATDSWHKLWGKK